MYRYEDPKTVRERERRLSRQESEKETRGYKAKKTRGEGERRRDYKSARVPRRQRGHKEKIGE